ncbi:hypothetical protein, partial [Candidatus Magnetaquicoccus inordinatus]|uniref:hypothetical protein n=1 Tax=Candidatus Magnetaquicoccus inordinatus TaxID=2496818 RepID=UPI00102BE3C4
MTQQSPREIVTPRMKMPMAIPEGMTAVEFFNSPSNLKNLAEENGLLRTPEDFLLYRKLLGHSMEFDTSIILDTSQRILNPLGRPVRRDQLSEREKKVWSRMTQTLFHYMLEKYPDPEQALVMCGEASLDPTWPLNKPGVPSIRMIHNHFIVFPQEWLRNGKEAHPQDINLTDSDHHGLFLNKLSDVYHRFFAILDLKLLKPVQTQQSQLQATGYPQGLPSWELDGGPEHLGNPLFWQDYDRILLGFLDFYRTFFGLASDRTASVPAAVNFPDHVDNILLFNNDFYHAAREMRHKILMDPKFANEIR